MSLIAVLNGFYGQTARFALFTLTAMILAVVIVTFVRWVDRITRLGRLGNTIDELARAKLAHTLPEDREEIRRFAALVGRR